VEKESIFFNLNWIWLSWIQSCIVFFYNNKLSHQ